MPNGTATVEDSLAVSYKAKHNLTIWFSGQDPRYLYNLCENLYLYKNLNVNVYNSFIHNQKYGTSEDILQ